MTAKGFAHLGAVCLPLFFTGQPCAATLDGSVDRLLITEIMANPAAAPDARGEWFELFNPTGDPVNLRGIDLVDDGGDLHRIESDLLILPGRFLTLARNGNEAVNGGFTADYVYADFTLSNGADEIILTRDSQELLRLDYFPGFAVAGRSRELGSLPMHAANYTLTLAGLSYGLGDIGTPGAAGRVDFTASTVPLPGTAWLFASGLAAFVLRAQGGRISASRRLAAIPAAGRGGRTA